MYLNTNGGSENILSLKSDFKEKFKIPNPICIEGREKEKHF